MIDVAVTPAELAPADTVVVIDVLRATSTATQALASGYRGVICVDSIERARALRAPGRVLAGERRCLMPDGFDLGNSPLAVDDGADRELVLCTTNGAPAIVAAAKIAGEVMLACLLNLNAVAEAIGGDVQIVCAGTDGALALEDVYAAGRLSALLSGERTDAALAAEAVARAYPTAIEALSASADARVLFAAGMADDITYCALESVLGVVPRVRSCGAGIASVAAADTVPV
jgi:2-phosphosulfolactate phosphatase